MTHRCGDCHLNVTMSELAEQLARRARHAALIQTVRGRPDLTIAQLEALLDGDYADELAEITIDELLRARVPPRPFAMQPGETLDDAILRVFQRLPARSLSSGFFTRNMGLERWTAQKALAELAERGLLVRTGRTSGTRYHLPS